MVTYGPGGRRTTTTYTTGGGRPPSRSGGGGGRGISGGSGPSTTLPHLRTRSEIFSESAKAKLRARGIVVATGADRRTFATFKDPTGKVVRIGVGTGESVAVAVERHTAGIQRRIAQSKIGVIVKVSVDPTTGERTFTGIRGTKQTFPQSGFTFTGRDKPGGLRSDERPAPGEFRRPQAERSARAVGEEVFKSLSRRKQRYRVGLPVTERGAGVTRVVEDVPGPRTREKKFGELTSPEKRQLFYSALGQGDPYGLRTKGLGKVDVGPPPSARPSGISAKQKAKEARLADFERRVTKFTKAEERFYASRYFKATERIAESASKSIGLGGITPLGFLPRGYAKELIRVPLDLPGAFGGLVLFTPGKAKFTGEALGYPETRALAMEELFKGAPKRVLKGFDPRKPAGAALLTFALVGGAIKGRTIRQTRGSIRSDIKSYTFKPPLVEKLKTSRVEKFGTVQTLGLDVGDIFLRKEGPVKFKYPRRLTQVKTVGAEAPTVTISKGIIKRAGRRYQFRSVQVGRNIYGSIRGSGGDVFFKKTKRSIEVKHLKPEDIYIRSPEIVKQYTQAYTKDLINLQRVDYAKKITRKQFDIGKKAAGGEVFFPERRTTRTVRFKAIGRSKLFRGGRDFSKAFFGFAEAQLRQIDKASKQVTLTKVGTGRPILKVQEPDIRYALQPTYKPHEKIFGMDVKSMGLEPTLEYLRRPELVTRRKTKFVSITRHIYERSRYKPFKGGLKVLGTVPKRLYDISRPAFRGKKAQIRSGLIEGVERIEVPRPKVKQLKPRVTSPFESMELGKLLPESAFRLRVFSLSKVRPAIKTEPKISTIVQPRLATFIQPRITQRIKATQKTFLQSRLRSIVKLRVTPRVMVTPRLTQRVTTRTKIPTPLTPAFGIGMFPELPRPPPPPPPPIIFPKLGPKRLMKMNKKLKKQFRYQPSLVAFAEGVVGKKPPFLTGIYVRPIIV